MSFDWKTCYDKLSKQGLTPCGDANNPDKCVTFIDENQDMIHALCTGGPEMGMPFQAVICKNTTGETRIFPGSSFFSDCMALAAKDPAAEWRIDVCYCCCNTYTSETMVAIPGGEQAVQKLGVGEKLLSGSLNSSNQLDWTPREVTFSNGMLSAIPTSMVSITFGDKEELVISPDHILMRNNGKLTTAMSVKTGDMLMGADGSAIVVTGMHLDNYKGGIHHITTDVEFNGSPNGHLINAGGVVSGDYTLQLHFDRLDADYKD
jgi:hypothetical protein